MNHKISKYCRIKNDLVNVNGKPVLKTVEMPGTSKQFKEIYLSLNIEYPKFYKMDMLSKLAFLATEFLKSDSFSETGTAIVLANRHSTKDTDSKYLKSINPENYFPNPALFVYTLPNVMIGEISIRNNLKGETVFISMDRFDGGTFQEVIDSLIFENCIAGFVEYENENNFEACVAFLEKSDEKCNKVSAELDIIYNSL